MSREVFRIEIPIEVQDKTDPGVSQATRKMSQFDQTIEKTKSKMDEFNKTKFSAVIEAVDKASAVAGRIGTTLKGITGKVWSVTMTVLDKATAPIRGVINLLKNPLIQLGAVIGVTVSLKDTIDTFATFEATMSKVQAVGGMTAKEIETVTEKAKEMGRTTKFTATEAGEAFTYMAQAGWSTQQMLAGIDGVLALSAADGLDLASTASIVTDTLAAFGLKAEDTSRFADVLAKAASTTNVDVAQMGETFKYVAPIAGAMGYSIDDMATAIGLMANASVKGSMAGTALKTAISNLVTPTDEQQKLMKQLGVNMTDSAGNAQSFHTVMSDLRTGFSKLSATEKTAAASTLFGSYAMSGMLAIMNASQEDFDSLSESIANSEGTAERMAEVMLDNVAGSFTLLQSAVEGVKITLGERLAPYLRQFASWLMGKMPGIEKAIGGVMDYIDDKVSWLRETIQEFTSGEDWENADVWGKIKIAWDKIVAEPFSAWWNSTGKAWFAEKAAAIGKGLGSGLKMGLLAILGIDVSKTFDEGQSVGASFIQGFKEGFDTEQITEALKTWAENNKEVVAALGVILGGKLIGGVYRGVKEAKSLITDIKNIFTKGSGNTLPGASPSAYTTTTMTVTANVVNVYGKSVNNIGQAAKDIIKTAGGAAGGAALGAGGAKALLTGGAAALPAAGAPLLLPGAAGGAATAATAGGLTSATGALGTLLQAGSTSSVIAADGTLVAVTGGVGGTLGSVGGALGTTATTAAGAAAAGVAGGAGIIGGLLGLGSAAIDLFKGIGKSKEGDTKGAKDEYVTAGTKTGMVAAGAGTGALIGSVVPGVGTAIGALVGAGVGGVGALLGGNQAGKALSDATDKDGGLTKFWESIKTGASNAGTWVADKWGETGDWISDKWSGFSDWFDTSVWTPVKDVGISAINIAAGAWSEVRDWIGDKWSDFSGWFDETVWDPVSSAAQTAGQWVSDRWNEARTWVGDRWSDFSGWFEESIWAPVKTGAQAAGEWVSEKWSDAKTWVNETWGTVSDWFSETVWEPVKGAAETAGEWLGTQFDAAWTAVSNAWDGVSGWFEDNVWGPIKSGATEAWNWVGEKLGGIGEWIGDKWTSFKDWLGGLGQKGSKETGLTTSQGKGSILEHAHGGIMTKPHMGIVAEAGAESIIPLSPSKRTRGIDLWRETGELLGVRPYADGGVVGKIKLDDEDMPVATGIGEWIGDKWSSFKDWLGGLGQKGSKETGLTTSQGKGSILEHAHGGIMTKPHMGIVAEAGAESIIPLSPSKRTRGIDLWRETGELLGVRPYANGGIVGGIKADDSDIPVAAALPAAGTPLLLPGAGGAAAAATAGGLTSATGALGTLLQAGSTSSVIAADGTLLAVTGGVGGTLGSVGGALGTTATTAAGAWSEVRDWIGDKWTSFKGWLSGLGQKGSKETGLTTSQGKGSVLEHAHGGIMTQPHMGIVAEAGAESIIPLSPSKRTRGIDLWRKTGELLGVRPYANGGIVGGIKADDSDIPVAAGSSGGGVTIKVEVSANPEITIGTSDTGDDERILSVLKTYIRSMADDIGDELAERLARIFANMPVRA